MQRDAAVSRQELLLAPILRLSNDVLVEIFTYVCADTVLGRESWANDIRLPQLHLCQVCKYWQSLVNDNPLLWSTLKFWSSDYLDSRNRIIDTTLLNLAKLILNRSGNCPLTITLDDDEDVHPVSALLFQHADRWLSASVIAYNQRFLSVSNFPQLKHLYFRYSGPDDIQTFPAMPSLESLIIGQPSAYRPFSLSDFPWKQLKRLALDTPLASQFATIVSWCVQLEHIALTFRSSDSLPPVSIVSQTITSTTLKQWEERERCENPFSLLQFPQLHTLEFDNCVLPADSTYPFITYSPFITNLSLKHICCDHGLLVLLRLLPTVTHLSFRGFYQPPEPLLDLFSNLRSSDPPSRTLLPRLAHFDMYMKIWDDNAEIDPGLVTSAFVEMVKSRVMKSRLETRLKSVQFSVSDYCLNHELISSLAYLKVGIAISIRDRCGFIL